MPPSTYRNMALQTCVSYLERTFDLRKFDRVFPAKNVQHRMYRLTRVNNSYFFPKQALVFTCLLYKSFENTMGKEEIASDKQFLVFHNIFYRSGELSATLMKFRIAVCKLF